MGFEAANLTDVIGTEVRGDIATLLTPPVAKELRRLLQQRGVLVFPQLMLTDDQQVELAKLLGTVRDEGEQGIFKITLDPTENAGAEFLKGSFLWHLDGTHDDIPVFASLLSGRKLSQVGGQTEFANSYAAYEALSPEMKARIDGLEVVHSFAVSMSKADVAATPSNVAYWNSIPEKTHKLVWTHEDGRKSLVIGCHAARVVGMDASQSDALIAELLEWATLARFVYRHQWTVGDLVIWDNTGVLHRAEPYPLDSGRMMHRTTLMGEEAFA